MEFIRRNDSPGAVVATKNTKRERGGGEEGKPGLYRTTRDNSDVAANTYVYVDAFSVDNRAIHEDVLFAILK